MLILVINCGSSSLKYQLFRIRDGLHASLAKGIVERIGSKDPCVCHEKQNVRTITRSTRCADHSAAMKIALGYLSHVDYGVIKDLGEIAGVGHRVVHGGEAFRDSTVITKKVLRTIEKYSELAPLHNPPAIRGIKACFALLGGVPQVAVFDTAFHQTMPPHAYLYGLPYRFYTEYGIRRYGFHGTSHRYVAHEAARKLKKPLSRLKVITCHLGNGCSITAVDRGSSIDTSMGFTPLEGLVMGTRAGDVDATVVTYLVEKAHCSLREIGDILNKQSGLLGISGLSNDMRDLSKAAKRGNARARLAIEIFVYRIKKYIGAYAAAMGGLDAVVFTAGIGEHAPWLVKRIARELNGVLGKRARFLVIPTNEELFIARETFRIVK